MDKKKIKILFVDDDYEVLKSTLEDIEDKIEGFFVEDEKACRKILKSTNIDLICLDGNLEDGITGQDVVKSLRTSGHQIPICMISGSENRNKEGLDVGANASITKTDLFEAVFSNPDKIVKYFVGLSSKSKRIKKVK